MRIQIDFPKEVGGGVVLTRQRVQPNGKLETRCSNCGNHFPTTLRLVRDMEVRNVPQCVSCRGRYRSRSLRISPANG